MLHNTKDSTGKLAPVAHQHVSAPGEGACCGTLMQQEVTTNQAVTPPHGRPRAPAAALRNAQAQEATLLLAAFCSAASEQRRTRRTHGVFSQP